MASNVSKRVGYLVFADPPYNIKKAEWDTFKSQEAYVKWSLKWIEQAARVLRPAGTLYICGFSEILADIKLPALILFSRLPMAGLALQKQSQSRFRLGPLP